MVQFSLHRVPVLAATLLAFAGQITGTSCCTGNHAVKPGCATQETAYHRDIFYIGGRSLTTSGGNITVDQIYVEKLTPSGGASPGKKPLVFFHGGGVSGISWLNTPDNRPGWASFFLQAGYPVYLVDANASGRSSENDIATFPMMPGTAAEILERAFTAPKLANDYPQSQLHTQWPGTGVAGDPIFDAFWKSQIPSTTNLAGQELVARVSGCELLRLLGTKSYLISHSMGGRVATLLANDCPEYIAGSIAIEPALTPFFSYGWGLGGYPASPWGLLNTRLDYDPPVTDPATELVSVSVGEETLEKRNCYLQAEPARKLPNISSVPFVMVTSEAGKSVTTAHCIIDFLTQAGGKPESIMLAERGIKGNGHFMMIEKNNLEVAAVIKEWIEDREAL